MKKEMIIKCSEESMTSATHPRTYSTTASARVNNEITNYSILAKTSSEGRGKYPVIEIANWFLYKCPMTHKKLQKLCYYAQAWNYAINNFRLEDTDYQAWIHGPVSPVLYEKFKSFRYETIHIQGMMKSNIEKKDRRILEDVWDTYGNMTGNALEALSHRELPWIDARRGFQVNERCDVVISPETMKKYDNSIATGK